MHAQPQPQQVPFAHTQHFQGVQHAQYADSLHRRQQWAPRFHSDAQASTSTTESDREGEGERVNALGSRVEPEAVSLRCKMPIPSVPRVYADINSHQTKNYWDYESFQIEWGFPLFFFLFSPPPSLLFPFYYVFPFATSDLPPRSFQNLETLVNSRPPDFLIFLIASASFCWPYFIYSILFFSTSLAFFHQIFQERYKSGIFQIILY